MKTTKDHQAADIEVGSALERIVAQPAIHARFINTLSRLEYVGARKLMKSQDSSELDRETLQHLVEETRHAWMLKKLACRLDASVEAGYGAEHTLAGDEGEHYFQSLDGEVSRTVTLSDASALSLGKLHYLYTSWLVELRAVSFYTAYEPLLKAADVPNVLSGILGDETHHLTAMQRSIESADPLFESHIEHLIQAEAELFQNFWRKVEACVQVAAA